MAERRVVWSTSDGDLRKARDPKPAAARAGGRVKVRREVAGRRGKAVTQAELRPYVASLTGTLNRWNGKSVVCYGERP